MELFFQFLGSDIFAVNLEHAHAAPRNAAQVVEGKRAITQPVVFEVKHEGVFAGGEFLRTFPADAF